jgi:phosphate starvation-inducible PhoH-like protein
MTKSAIKASELNTIEPMTGNQDKAFQLWDEGENLILAGSAGTGKTFLALYLALDEMLNEPEYDKIIIVRSVVAVREIGYLPGKLEEKTAVFETPYKMICDELFEGTAAYNKMINSHQIQFETTSYIRGKTFDRAIIVVDEMQNLNFHELDSIMTRVGEHCRIIFAGDYLQSDFKSDGERDGLMKFLNIIERMNQFSMVQFGWDDIVRSGIVRDYIMTKEMIGVK